MARTDSERYAFLGDREDEAGLQAGGAAEQEETGQGGTGTLSPGTTEGGDTGAGETSPARTWIPDAPANDYDGYNALVEEYLGKPLTPKERARRERGATAAQAVGALGNVMSAFSNLAFTGGVAPSQELPDLPDVQKHIDNFRNREGKNREAYIRARMQTSAMKRQDYANQLKRAELARKVAKDEMEDKNKKALSDAKIQLMGAQRDKNAEQQAYWQAKTNALEQGLPYDLAEKQARAALYYYRARGGGSGGGNLVPVQVVDPATGRLVTIRVTGNKAADLLSAQEGDESNLSTTHATDAWGGKSSRTTERGKSARQKSAEHTRKAREEADRKKKGESYSHTKALGL